MLKDADPHYFAGVYIVCGYTDLRFGIDSLAAIIERRFHMHLFVPNTLFLFCGRSSTRIKGLLWEGDGFLLLKKCLKLCTALFLFNCVPFPGASYSLSPAFQP